MAANAYYNDPVWSQSNIQPQQGSRLDNPLPRPPNDSPFTDHSYPYSNQQDHKSDRYNNPFLDQTYPAQTPNSQHGESAYFGNDSSNHGQGESIALQEQSQGQFPKYGRQNSLKLESQPAGGFGGRGRRGRFDLGAKRPWFVYVVTAVQIGVFVGEIIKNIQLTRSPIMTRPSFNPMIGPSVYVLINMGARFVPCMRAEPGINDVPSWPCPNTTTSDALCSLPQLCGFGAKYTPGVEPGVDNGAFNQWFRFILPMFLHAGIIHIGFNMLLQLTLGKEMELAIGTLRFALVYLSSGIFGFVLGGNYAANGIASTGASGCLFGILALVLLDIIYSWKSRKSPKKDLAFLLIEIVISFILGLLPGLDNFSHIGGFLMGLVLGLCILHSPDALRKRTEQDAPPYTPVTNTFGDQESTALRKFIHGPLNFFKGRKPLWWAWWLIRVGSLIAVIIGFILLLNNFYKYRVRCGWCKYLSCLPISNWCDLGNLRITTQQSPNPNRVF